MDYDDVSWNFFSSATMHFKGYSVEFERVLWTRRRYSRHFTEYTIPQLKVKHDNNKPEQKGFHKTRITRCKGCSLFCVPRVTLRTIFHYTCWQLTFSLFGFMWGNTKRQVRENERRKKERKREDKTKIRLLGWSRRCRSSDGLELLHLGLRHNKAPDLTKATGLLSA